MLPLPTLSLSTSPERMHQLHSLMPKSREANNNLTLRSVISLQDAVDQRSKRKVTDSVVIFDDCGEYDQTTVRTTTTSMKRLRRMLLFPHRISYNNNISFNATKRVRFATHPVSFIVEAMPTECSGRPMDDVPSTLESRKCCSTWYSDDDYVQFLLCARQTVKAAQSSLQSTGEYGRHLDPTHQTLLGLEHFLCAKTERERVNRVRFHRQAILKRVSLERQHCQRNFYAQQTELTICNVPEFATR